MNWISVKERFPAPEDGWCLINGPITVPIDHFKGEVVEKYKMLDKNMFRFTAIVNMKYGLKLDQFILHAWSGSWGSGYSKESSQRWRDFTAWIVDRPHKAFIKKIPHINRKDIELWIPLFQKEEERCLCKKFEKALDYFGQQKKV